MARVTQDKYVTTRPDMLTPSGAAKGALPAYTCLLGQRLQQGPNQRQAGFCAACAPAAVRLRKV